MVSGLTPAAEYYGNALVGVEPFPRWAGGTSRTLISGWLYLSYFTPPQSVTVTNMLTMTDGVAAAATPSLCRMGIFTIAANGDGTLVAAIANDTSLFAAGSTKYTRVLDAGGGLPTSYTYTAGQRYAHGLLVISAAAMPNIWSNANRGGFANALTNTPRIAGQIFVGGAGNLGNFVVASVAEIATAFWIGAIA